MIHFVTLDPAQIQKLIHPVIQGILESSTFNPPSVPGNKLVAD